MEHKDAIWGSRRYCFKISGNSSIQHCVKAKQNNTMTIESDEINITLQPEGSRTIKMAVTAGQFNDRVKVTIINCGSHVINFTGTLRDAEWSQRVEEENKLERTYMTGTLPASRGGVIGKQQFDVQLQTRQKGERKRPQSNPRRVLQIIMQINVLTRTVSLEGNCGRHVITNEVSPHGNLATLATDLMTILTKRYRTDITLLVQTQLFPAHKVILSARSEVFAAMFGHEDFNEHKTNHVTINDMDSTTFITFLEFIYQATLPVEVSFDEASLLLDAAEKYQVTSLISTCTTIILDKLTEHNAIRTAILGYQYQSQQLMLKAVDKIIDSEKTLKDMSGYDALLREGKEVLVDIIELIQAKATTSDS